VKSCIVRGRGQEHADARHVLRSESSGSLRVTAFGTVKKMYSK
jgi:hypothetical protein